MFNERRQHWGHRLAKFRSDSGALPRGHSISQIWRLGGEIGVKFVPEGAISWRCVRANFVCHPEGGRQAGAEEFRHGFPGRAFLSGQGTAHTTVPAYRRVHRREWRRPGVRFRKRQDQRSRNNYSTASERRLAVRFCTGSRYRRSQFNKWLLAGLRNEPNVVLKQHIVR